MVERKMLVRWLSAALIAGTLCSCSSKDGGSERTRNVGPGLVAGADVEAPHGSGVAGPMSVVHTATGNLTLASSERVDSLKGPHNERLLPSGGGTAYVVSWSWSWNLGYDDANTELAYEAGGKSYDLVDGNPGGSNPSSGVVGVVVPSGGSGWLTTRAYGRTFKVSIVTGKVSEDDSERVLALPGNERSLDLTSPDSSGTPYCRTHVSRAHLTSYTPGLGWAPAGKAYVEVYGDQTCVGGGSYSNRMWVVVGSDGTLYSLASDGFAQDNGSPAVFTVPSTTRSVTLNLVTRITSGGSTSESTALQGTVRFGG